MYVLLALEYIFSFRGKFHLIFYFLEVYFIDFVWNFIRRKTTNLTNINFLIIYSI